MILITEVLCQYHILYDITMEFLDATTVTATMRLQ